MKRLILSLFLLALVLPATAQERVWDQEAARRKVQAVLELESQGRPWDDINWLTSIEQGEQAAVKNQNPLGFF